MRRPSASSLSRSSSLTANTLLYSLVIRYFSSPCTNAYSERVGHFGWSISVQTIHQAELFELVSALLPHLDSLLLMLPWTGRPDRMHLERGFAGDKKLLSNTIQSSMVRDTSTVLCASLSMSTAVSSSCSTSCGSNIDLPTCTRWLSPSGSGGLPSKPLIKLRKAP